MIWFATLSFKCKSFKAYKQQSLCRVDAPVTIVIGQSWKHVQWLVDLLTNFTACITCITCITWITSITCITCITGITGITGNPKNINDSLTHWVTTWNQEMLAHLKSNYTDTNEKWKTLDHDVNTIGTMQFLLVNRGEGVILRKCPLILNVPLMTHTNPLWLWLTRWALWSTHLL